MICLGIDPAQDGFHAVALCAKADGGVYMDTYRKIIPIDKHVPVLRSWILYQLSIVADVVVGAAVRSFEDADEDNTVYIFCEEPLVAGARNLRTSLKLAQAVGAIMAGVGPHTGKTYLVPVSKWKLGTCGAGNASKTQVAGWLSSTHPAYAAQCDGSQDLTDACCIALYGLSVIADAELVRTVGSSGQL